MTTEEVPTSSGSSEDTSRYEELRLQHISDLLARMPENIRRVKWPAERIREERQGRLRSLIRVAKQKSPWHRDRLKHVNADSITAGDLDHMPVMTQPSLMNNLYELITDERLTMQRMSVQ